MRGSSQASRITNSVESSKQQTSVFKLEQKVVDFAPILMFISDDNLVTPVEIKSFEAETETDEAQEAIIERIIVREMDEKVTINIWAIKGALCHL